MSYLQLQLAFTAQRQGREPTTRLGMAKLEMGFATI
jgi:hypothetical protein